MGICPVTAWDSATQRWEQTPWYSRSGHSVSGLSRLVPVVRVVAVMEEVGREGQGEGV